MAPRPKPATLEIATLESITKIVQAATIGQTQTIAVGTAQASAASAAGMERENDLTRRWRESMDREEKLCRELREERSKNAEQTIRLEELRNQAAKVVSDRESAKEVIAGAKELGGKVVNALALQAAAKAAAEKSALPGSVSDKPIAEVLIDELIRDLSPSTLSILYKETKHILLPLVARPEFLISVYNQVISSMTSEMFEALAADLGTETSVRLGAIHRAVSQQQSKESLS